MSTSQTLAAFFSEARTLLINAQSDPAISAALARYGYDAERLAAGAALLDAAEEQARAQQTEYAEQYAATNALEEAQARLRATYHRHVKLARVAFVPDTLAYKKLDLRGERKRGLGGLLAQTEAFYRALQSDAALQSEMATLTVDEAAVAEALAQVEAVKAARAAQVQERGEAQAATRTRDAAVAQLRGYLRDLRRIAEVALEDQPQALEKLGILER
jgi:hypothetical protein